MGSAELASHRLVVPDRANPPVGAWGFAAPTARENSLRYGPSADPLRHRLERRGCRPQVQVMIVQAGNDGTQLRVEDDSLRRGVSCRATSLITSPTRISVTRPSSRVARWISMRRAVPRSAPGRTRCRRRVRGPGVPAIAVARTSLSATPRSGSPANVAATAAIDTSTTTPPPRLSASSTAAVAAKPVNGSAIASPQNIGPSSPATTSPPATAASSPKATRSGWSWPYPLTRNQIRPRRAATCVGRQPAPGQRRGP